jgi:hypothetical protein
LKPQIRGKLLVIWDGLPAHRSRLVRDYVESLGNHIVLERLPGYAPELNPVEYLFATPSSANSPTCACAPLMRSSVMPVFIGTASGGVWGKMLEIADDVQRSSSQLPD